MNKVFCLKLIIVTCLLLVTPTSLIAYEVLPISASLAPSGRDATKDIKVINGGTAPIAIEVTMVTRQQNLDGSEQRKVADSEFVIYPQQMVIKAKSSQNVRIQWLGEPNVKIERNYRFIIKQIPVNLEYASAAPKAVKFNLIMEGSLYIQPASAKSDITVGNATIQGKMVNLILENQGTSHSLLKNVKLTLNQSGRQIELNKEDVPQVEGKNILAGARRSFIIPLPSGIRAGQPVTASVKYDEMLAY